MAELINPEMCVIKTRLDLDEDHLTNPIQEEKNMIKKHEF